MTIGKTGAVLLGLFLSMTITLIGAAEARAAELDVTAAAATKKEVRHSMIGLRSTLLLYTFPGQKAALRLVIDNKDTSFPVTGKLYTFDNSVTAEGLKKWVNNQYSDALFPDVPRPVSTHDLPAKTFTIASQKLIDRKKGPRGIEHANYAVTLKVGDYQVKGAPKLKGFSVDTTVHVKQ
jgi:hypothetical protein